MEASRGWAYFRIIAGTLVGGAIGFYVKYRIETRYRQKMMEQVLEYERQQQTKEAQKQELSAGATTVDDSSELLSDS